MKNEIERKGKEEGKGKGWKERHGKRERKEKCKKGRKERREEKRGALKLTGLDWLVARASDSLFMTTHFFLYKMEMMLMTTSEDCHERIK